MFMYIILTSLLVLFFFLSKNYPNGKKIFLILSLALIVTMSSLRSIDLGINDVRNVYLRRYETIANSSFFDIFGFDTKYSGSILWCIFTKVSQYIWYNYHFYLGLLCFLTLLPMFIYIEKKSEYPLLSVLIFISVFYSYSLYLLRHFFALSFIFWFLLFDTKKVIRNIFLVLAFLIHPTSIIFPIIYYMVSIVENKKILFIFSLLLVFLIYVFNKNLVACFLSIFSKEYYKIYTSGIYSVGNLNLYLLIFYGVMAIPIFIKNTDLEQEEKIFIFSFPLLFSMIISEDFYRLSFYLIGPYLLLFPNKFSDLEDKYKLLYEIGYAIICIVTFIYIGYGNNAIPFEFYWR